MLTPARTVAPSLLLALSACLTYQPRAVSVAGTARDLTARSLESPAVQRVIVEHDPQAAITWPPARWTPELLTLAAVALHPDLNLARADWEVARAALLTAAERPNPAGTASLERKSGSGSVNPWITNLSLDLPIETAGKRGARIAQAKALSVAAAADVDQVIWSVRSRAAAAVVDLATSRQLAVVRREELRLREEIVAMLEKRLELGEVSRPEVSRVRADERGSRLQLRDEEGRATEREAALASAIGIPQMSLPELDLGSLSSIPPEQPDSARLQELALTARPDVLAAISRYDAAEQALRLEVRRQFPDLHVGPGIGWDQGAFRWAISATAEIPILNQHRGPIAEAVARRGAAAAQLMSLQAKILGDLDAALASERTARMRLVEAERVLAEKQSLAAAVRRQFAAGEIDRLTLRNQELEVAQAEIDRWTAIFDLQRAIVAVEGAVEQPKEIARSTP